MDYTVEQSGALKQPPEKISRLMRKNVSSAINDTVRPALDIVRGPIPKGESGLYQSIKLKRATIAKPEGTIDSQHPLLEVVEEKTSPHLILPRGSVSDMVAGTSHRALRFKIKGQVFFAARVKHPGTKGKHSWKRAFEFVEAGLGPAIQAAVEAAISGQEYTSGPRAYTNRETPVPLAYNPLK